VFSLVAKFSSLSRAERLLGAMLVGVGLVCNEWILAKLFSPDGFVEDISLKGTLWVFEIACVLTGSFILLYGTTLLILCGRAALDRISHHARWCLVLLAGAMLALWVAAAQQVYEGGGLFRWLGTDYGIYLAQANVLRSGDPRGIYSIDAIENQYQQLVERYPDVLHDSGRIFNIPYPPLFALLFTPFTFLEPHIGFILWTFVNAIAALYLAWRAAAFFQKIERPCAVLLLLSSYPVVFCLFVGQPQFLLACAVSEFYLALRKGRDFRAGLYLSLLLFKPQYGGLLGPLLIWKRRWAAVVGAGLGAVVVIGGSVIAAGVRTLLEYPTAITEMAKFRSDLPKIMLNFRSLILWLSPRISDQSGMLLQLLLSGLIVLITALAWKGAWAPRAPRFSVQISLALVATLLANHQSHAYGAVLLAVPLASALAEADLSRFTRIVVIAACLLPTLSFTLLSPLNTPQASRLLLVLLSTCYASLLVDLWVRNRHISREFWGQLQST
jgi:Glycosyltransferase family 87